MIISHGHYDRSGGFIRLIKEINPDIKLYIGREFFNEKYNRTSNGGYEYAGNPFDESFLKANNVEIGYIDQDVTKITENLSIYANFNRDKEFENINETMLIRDGEGYKKDTFYDEISLGITTSKGLVALVGCSHAGIVNILKTINKRTEMDIHAVVGGTHLVKEDDEKINNIIDYFKENDIKVIGACHCTGKQGEKVLKEQIKDKFINNNTGDVLKI